VPVLEHVERFVSEVSTMICEKVIGFGLAIVLLFVVGCGRHPGTQPTAKVTGTVTYNGQPIERVSVVFTPESGRPASGVTDASGKFTLSTFAPGDGALPGLHKVGLREAPDIDMPMPGTPEAAGWQPAKAHFPEKYADPAQSGFTARVQLGKRNEFRFDMSD
jgi:hypothetical protein